MDLINASRKLQVILDGNKENPNVTNRDTPKINFNIHSTKDKPAKNDWGIFDNSSSNLSLTSPTPYVFGNNSRKSDISDDSTLVKLHRMLVMEILIIVLDRPMIGSLLVLRGLYGYIFDGRGCIFKGWDHN